MDRPSDHFYTVEDFLESAAFRAWVRDRRPHDRVYWQEWLDRYPESRPLYEQAVATLLVIEGRQAAFSDRHVNERIDRIREQLTPSTTPVRPLWGGYWHRWAAAAAVVSLLVWWQIGSPTGKLAAVLGGQAAPSVRAADWKSVKNVTGQPLVVLLPDASSVLLSSGSQLRFQKQNTHKLREVYLQGEGFFEVSKDPAKPFVVHTSRLTTRVLGTSFQVRSYANEPAAYVKVKTGKVSVTPVDTPDRLVVLTKNEQLRLESQTDQVVKGAVAASGADASSIVSQQFTFEFTPVADVFTRLESSYHMPIRYDRQALIHCTFTGQLNDVPFLEKMRLICLTTESTFSVIDNQIVVQSRGCD